MLENVPGKKIDKEKMALIALFILGAIILFLLLLSIVSKNKPQTNHTTQSDLINTKDIATLSVSEFVYNGIARTYKENGEPDFNALYRSTVKVSVDADNIDYSVDEENKTIRLIFPEFDIQRPIIDEGSISVIPDRKDLEPDELIKLCRADSLEEAKKSGKLISSARENLKSIMEAWYSPVFEGYTFEYQFGTAEGGEAE